jgi:predicted RNA-binding Zn ribbon-like protein
MRRSGTAEDQVGAALAEAAIEFLAESDLDRPRECASEACVLLFYAKNPKRRWCSAEGCGNRERVRRHYHRHRH